jgi:hypothetical protein
MGGHLEAILRLLGANISYLKPCSTHSDEISQIYENAMNINVSQTLEETQGSHIRIQFGLVGPWSEILGQCWASFGPRRAQDGQVGARMCGCDGSAAWGCLWEEEFGDSGGRYFKVLSPPCHPVCHIGAVD